MKQAVIVLVIAAAIRLLMAAIVPIVPDEAYYWEWSRHLAPGYFDHPPAIAWLIWPGTKLIGDSPLGVRSAPIVAGFVGSLVAVTVARDIGGGHAARRAAVSFSVLPMAGIGLVLATPDVPLLVSEAIALWAVCRILVASPAARRRSGHSELTGPDSREDGGGGRGAAWDRGGGRERGCARTLGNRGTRHRRGNVVEVHSCTPAGGDRHRLRSIAGPS